MRSVCLLALLCASCVDSSSTDCGNGFVCRQGTVCADAVVLETPTTLCVEQGQLDACQGIGDRTACTFGDAPATCHGGACIADDCGNGLVDSVEACDDGNTVPDDGCAADCLSNEQCGNGFVDASQFEQCDLGGDHLGHDGCTSACQSEALAWQRVEDDRPRTRYWAGAAYDPRTQEAVLFGGIALFPGPTQTAVSDTYTWDGISARRKNLLVVPVPRPGPALVYDEARGVIVLYGGGNRNDTWTLRGSRWQLESPATSPTPIADASNRGVRLVYERARQRAILVGVSGTWAWDGTTWTQLPQSANEAILKRAAPALGYDEARNVVVMFGGEPYGSGSVDDVWELVGDTWVERSTTGTPAPRYGASLTYSPRDGELLLVGGAATGVSHHRDAYLFNGTRWQAVAQPPPPTIDTAQGNFAQYTYAEAVLDSTRGVVVVFGANGMIHEWDGTAWRTPPGGVWTDTPTPPYVSDTVAAADVPHKRFVMYGGFYPSGGDVAATDETWSYDGRWKPEPAFSPGRFGAMMVYDPIRDHFVLFGGYTDASGASQQTAIFKMFPAAPSTWTLETPATSPSARYRGVMVYDTKQQRVVLWGGRDESGATLDDMWTWDGTTWTQVTQPATRPLHRFRAASGYDPIHHKLVVFGGSSVSAGVETRPTETWTWDGTTWNQIAGPGPAWRTGARMAWDAARKTLVMAGGSLPIGSAQDAWEFDGATDTWRVVQVTGLAREGAAFLSAPDRSGGVVLYGGFEGDPTAPGAFKNEMWRLTWDSTQPYETCRLNDFDGDTLVGCVDPDCWFQCTPNCPPGASCPALPVLCGDGTCDIDRENCTTCPGDCGTCM